MEVEKQGMKRKMRDQQTDKESEKVERYNNEQKEKKEN